MASESIALLLAGATSLRVDASLWAALWADTLPPLRADTQVGPYVVASSAFAARIARIARIAYDEGAPACALSSSRLAPSSSRTETSRLPGS